MPNTIDSTGFSRVRFQDLRAEKEQQYKDGFANQELKTDVQSGVGQEISISTFAEDDLASRMQDLIAAFDPTAAQGVNLSRLAVVMNKRRQDETSSTVTLTLTADASGATIPAGFGFEVSNTAGDVTFRFEDELIIAPSGTADVLATSTESGAVAAIAGSLTVIKTPVFGVASVTNNADASLGRDRETDTELRARMLASSSDSSPTVIGIGTAVSEVDGVTDYQIVENATDAPDADGVPAHSIFPIVENGSDDDIARALITNVAAGIGYTEPADIPAANIVSGTYDDPTTGQTYTAYWARPDDVQVYVDVTLNKLATYPPDGDDLVKAAIEQWVLDEMQFSEDLYASQLYGAIQEIEGAIVVDVKVGTSPSPSDSVVAIEIYEKAAVSSDDVVVGV
jgi:uncharacterized phage protein gp47/JayE